MLTPWEELKEGIMRKHFIMSIIAGTIDNEVDALRNSLK